MEWQTKEQIKERSTSPREAFTVSIEKYERWLCVSEEELKNAIRGQKTDCTSEWCGLCYYYRNGGCPLNSECDLENDICKCCSEWEAMERTVPAIYFGWCPTKDSIRSMLCRLYSERDKLPKEKKEEPKKEVKPEIRHGDYDANELYLERAPWISDTARCGKAFPVAKNGAFTNVSTGDRHIIKLGNIFSELEALKEPLRKFRIQGNHGDSLSVKIISGLGGDEISFSGTSDILHLGLEDIPEFILNLRRLVATAKLKSK